MLIMCKRDSIPSSMIETVLSGSSSVQTKIIFSINERLLTLIDRLLINNRLSSISSHLHPLFRLKKSTKTSEVIFEASHRSIFTVSYVRRFLILMTRKIFFEYWLTMCSHASSRIIRTFIFLFNMTILLIIRGVTDEKSISICLISFKIMLSFCLCSSPLLTNCRLTYPLSLNIHKFLDILSF